MFPSHIRFRRSSLLKGWLGRFRDPKPCNILRKQKEENWRNTERRKTQLKEKPLMK